MATLNLFPARVRFVNDDGTLTPEAYRTLQVLSQRVGGPLGDNGRDVFGDITGVTALDLSIMDTVTQPTAEQALADMVQQPVGVAAFVPDVVQPPNEAVPLDLATAIHAAASKTTPVDADEMPLADSAATFKLKRLTWGNLKATLAAWIAGNLIPASFTTINASSLVDISASSAGQIKFPASQNSSADVNTLDDYEEGVWTPIDASGAALSLSGSGSYVKIGKAVYFQSVIVYPANSNASTALINGLPFTTAAGSGSQGRSGLFISASTVALVGGLYTDNSTTFFVHTSGLTKATNANLTGAIIYVSGLFFV